MNNALLQIKIKQRLNKLASFDYDNLECWQIAEAFNKAQIEWTRRQLYGYNIRKEGAEQSSGLVDDLQRLIIHESLDMIDKGIFYQSELPANYLHYVRTDIFAKKECCPERRIIVYEVEEANISIILDNKDKAPNFEWSETVATLMNNKLKKLALEIGGSHYPEVSRGYLPLTVKLVAEDAVRVSAHTALPSINFNHPLTTR